MRNLTTHVDSFELKAPFVISRGQIDSLAVLTVCIAQDGIEGWGECVPSGSRMVSADEGRAIAHAAQHRLQDWWSALEQHDPAAIDLNDFLPKGPERNALDCALWDLKAKKAGMPIWKLLGMVPPATLLTAHTISLADTARMAENAHRHRDRKLIKVKLGGPDDERAIAAIRAVAPEATLVVDVNGGWSFDQLVRLAPHMKRCGVSLIEQPLPDGADAELTGYTCCVPLCADESCHDRDDLPTVQKRYQAINVKLDKTGGMTEALLLVRAARAAGLTVMVGCMAGTSLSMAPGAVIGSLSDFVDLDGPLLLKRDRPHGFAYGADGRFRPGNPSLWG